MGTAAVASLTGIEETSVRALAKLEQVLPERLRRRVNALGTATSAFGVDAPTIDADVLATLAAACRDGIRVRFSYLARDERTSHRNVEPSAVVHSGYRWYVVAFDLDRDDWRTFRLDRIRGRVRLGERGRRRTVPGGDPAVYVRSQLRSLGPGEVEAEPGRFRMGAPAATIRRCIPERYATVEPDGEDACFVTTRGGWTRSFLVRAALLDEPFEVLGPPELADAARALVARLEVTAGPG
jgi:predicted DNA-binding transcriptional regulator YafY